MTTVDTGFGREQQEAVLKFLGERLMGPVAIDVWSRKESPILLPDREPATHAAETVLLARQLAALHPAFTITLYDLDRHAQRAAEAGIDRAPTTVFRGVRGRELRFVGSWIGAVFQSVLEAIVFLGAGGSPLTEESRSTLAALERDVNVEVLGAMYDPYSAHLLRLIAALSVETRHVRASFIEMVEYPILAAARQVEQVPVVTVDGHRGLGSWDEPELVEWIRRLANGDESVVTRAQLLTSPYYTESDIDRLIEEREGHDAAPPLPASPSGLYISGR
ncbi:MAG: hypothetical protein EXR68_00060 [Dehalococcoidia bacterium]|nr:hypothetical protein [Dehalococcoidia bacterium]